jgi:hypothetical protein
MTDEKGKHIQFWIDGLKVDSFDRYGSCEPRAMSRDDGIFGDDDDGVFGRSTDDADVSSDATWQHYEKSKELQSTDPTYNKHWGEYFETDPVDNYNLLLEYKPQRGLAEYIETPALPWQEKHLRDLRNLNKLVRECNFNDPQVFIRISRLNPPLVCNLHHPIYVGLIQEYFGGGIYRISARDSQTIIAACEIEIIGDPKDPDMSKLSRNLTKREFLEILHKYVSTTELKEHSCHHGSLYISKTEFLNYAFSIDKTISSVSFDKHFKDIFINGSCLGYFETYHQQKTGDTEAVITIGISNLLYNINNSFNYLDNEDEEAEEPQAIKLAMPDELVEYMKSLNSNIEKMAEHQLALAQQQTALAQAANQLFAQQQAAEKAIEEAAQPKVKTMAEKIRDAALETGTGVVSAFQEGLKISGSQRLSKKVVKVFHNNLGKHIPGAETAIGVKVEGVMIPALVHFMANAFSDKVPKADIVQRTCLRAITGEAKDSGDELLDMFLPVFAEIASMDNMTELAAQFVDEDEGQLAENSSAKSLAESVAGQLSGIPEGAKVEITVKHEGAEKTSDE